jgi:hypothetical protein
MLMQQDTSQHVPPLFAGIASRVKSLFCHRVGHGRPTRLARRPQGQSRLDSCLTSKLRDAERIPKVVGLGTEGGRPAVDCIQE